MIEPMHLYPEEKKRMQEAEKQGLSVMTCNNWLCPFNNDGYCVEPTKGDICGIYGDEDFNKYLDVVYDENYSDDFRDSVRRVMIARWGKKEQRLIYADAIEKVLEEKHFKRVLDSDRWLIADIKKSIMDLPTVDAVPVIRCKDCKHFEYDHFDAVYFPTETGEAERVPLITAHEICTRWGDGCKTYQNGFCFMAERKEE